MSAPNIINSTSIVGTNAKGAVTTSLASLVTNASGSNTVYKIGSLNLANYTAASVTVTITVLNGGVTHYLGGSVTIPAYATLMPISKDNTLYMVEGDALQISASSNSAVWAICSYEVVS